MDPSKRPGGKQKWEGEVYRGFDIRHERGWWKAYSPDGIEVVSDALTLREVKKRIDEGVARIN